MTRVTIHQAKTNLSRLIAEVADGGEVVICRGAEPVARLVSLQPRPGVRAPGAWKGRPGFGFDEAFLDPLPADELARWTGEGD